MTNPVPTSHPREAEHRRQIAHLANRLLLERAGVNAFAFMSDKQRSDVLSGKKALAVHSAIEGALSQVDDLYLPNGTYRFDDEVSITASNKRLFLGRNAVIDMTNMANGTTLFGKRAFHISGSEASATTVDSDISAGDTEITVGDSSGLAAEDWIEILSDELYMDGVSGSTDNRGHITQIESVDSATGITLVDPSPFAYATAENARILKYTMLEGIEFHGGRILGGGVGSAHNGVMASYTLGLVVEGMTIDDCESTGIRVTNSSGASVRFNRISDCTSPSSIGNTGYGVVFVDGTRNSEIVRNVMTNCKVGVSGGGDPPAIMIDVVGNKVIGAGTSGLDCHEPSFWWSFRQNTISGCGDIGINCRGQYTVAEGNRLLNVTGDAIRIRGFHTNTDGISGARILNNTIDGGGSGIRAVGASGQLIKDTLISGNYVRNATFESLPGTFMDGVTIVDNDFPDSIALSNLSGDVLVENNMPSSETATGTFTADLYIKRTDIDSSSAAVTATLPDGTFDGQRKKITMSDASNSSTLSVTSHETSSPESFTFAATTDSLLLEWDAANAYWWTVKNIGAAT